MDIKLIDPAAHKTYCGIGNDVILENFHRLIQDGQEMGLSFLPRTPLIPDITDTDENLTAIAALYEEAGITETELLAYNPTWYGKNDKLGITLADELKGLDGFQPGEKIEHCKEIFRARGIKCR